MTTIVERVSDEPIILITVQGHLDAQIMQNVYRQVADLTRTIDGPVYRIIDLRQMEVTLGDMVEIIKEAGKGTPGSASDPRNVNLFVGNSHMSRFAADMLRLRRFGGLCCVLMNTMDDAIAYVRQKSGSSSPSGV